MCPGLNPAVTTEKPVHELLHGIDVEDPYRWLEDQRAPETRAFIQVEQRAYRAYLDSHAELRARIERRVKQLLTVPSVDLPVSDRCGGLLYLKREAQQEQKAIYWEPLNGSECLLLSPAMLGRDGYCSLTVLQVSRNGRYLAFGIRTGGEDIQQIGIYDLLERRLLPDRLPRGFIRGLVFDRDQRGFYYVLEEVEGVYKRRHAVRFHGFSSDPRCDYEVFCAGDDPGVRGRKRRLR